MSDPRQIARRGIMLVLSSPSGAGKTTISRELLAREPELTLSVSATTRPPRAGERDGVDYHFIDRDRYEEMVANDEFLEHAMVFGNAYGTPRGPVEKTLGNGRDMLFDVDWQGAQEMQSRMPQDMVSVFILPPSADELERRLRGRAQDSDEVIEKRMAKATAEMSHYSDYDYIVVNVEVEESVSQVRSILTAERLRRERRVGLHDFVRTLGVGE